MKTDIETAVCDKTIGTAVKGPSLSVIVRVTEKLNLPNEL